MKLLQLMVFYNFLYMYSFKRQNYLKYNFNPLSETSVPYELNFYKLSYLERRSKRYVACYDIQSCCYITYEDERASLYMDECTFEFLTGKSPCFTRCYANRSGLLKESGVIDIDKFINDLNHKMKHRYKWVTAESRINILESCINIRQAKLTPHDTCTDLLNNITRCSFVEAQLLCPKGLIRDSLKCTQFLTYLKMHKKIPPRLIWCNKNVIEEY